MKVYIIVSEDYYGGEIKGFRTPEEAQTRIDEIVAVSSATDWIVKEIDV